jgi:DNA repair exonuclease SbcCD ATPase subunit
MAYMAMAQAKPEIKTVLNYDKNLIMGYTITYEYPVEDIENAIIERLEKEGVEGSKKKNFYAFKGIKYNYIWNKTFDMYVQFTGSKNAGTINMILSQGYDNFIIPTEDSLTTSKVYDWLISLDLDVQNYRYNLAMEAHKEEYKGIDKELSKLEKQRTKIENKIKKNADAQLKFEASKTIIGENDLNVDTKKIEKEEKQAQKLLDEKNKLEGELEKINHKIDNVRSDLNKKNNVISDLEKDKPKSNTLKVSKKK